MEYSNLDAFFLSKTAAHSIIDESTKAEHFTNPTTNIEALLHRILNTLEKHEGALHQLNQNSMQLGHEMKITNKKILDVCHQMDNSKNRIDSIEQTIQVDCNSKKLTLGELVVSNRKAIINTLNIVSNKIDSEDLKDALASQNISWDKALKDLGRDMASNDAMQKTHETINSIITRIDIIYNELQSKVDKTLYKALSSKAAVIQNYADFVTLTESSIKDLKENLEKYSYALTSCSKQLQEIATSLVNFATKCELKELKCNLKEISEQVDHLKTSLEQTKVVHDERLSKVQNDAKTLFESHKTLAKYFTLQMGKIYDKSDIDKFLSKFVTRDSLDSTVTKISTELELKANASALYQLQQSIDKIELDTETTKRKAELSAQFITLLDGERAT
jgi:flagellar biosynthesis chaperone FliJ